MKSTSQGTSMRAHEVGQEEDRALEHADEEQVAALVVRRDLLRRARGRGAPARRAGRGSRRSAGSRIQVADSSVSGAAAAFAPSAARRRRRPRGRPRPRPARRRASARSSSDAPGARGHRPPGRVLGQPPHDEPGERRRQRREVLGADVVAAVEHRRHELVEHLGLLAQELRRSAATLRSAAGCSARSAGTRPSRARARAYGAVGVGRVLAPRQPALAAVRRGLLARDIEQRPHEQAVARRSCRAARAGPATPRAGRGSSRPGRSSCARSPPARRARSRGRAAAPRRASRAQAWRLPGAVAGPDRSTTSSTPRPALSARQCASSPSDSSPRRPWLTWSATHLPGPAMRAATSSRQTESRPPLSSTTTGAPGGRSPVARTRSSRSLTGVGRPGTARSPARSP